MKFSKRFTRNYTRSHDLAIGCAIRSIGTFVNFNSDDREHQEKVLICSIIEFKDAYIEREHNKNVHGVIVQFKLMDRTGKVSIVDAQAYDHGKEHYVFYLIK